MEDIWIHSCRLWDSDFINKLQLIESANYLSPEEPPENTQKIIDNVILCFDFYEIEITDIGNPKLDSDNGEINILSLFNSIWIRYACKDYSKLKQTEQSFPFCWEIEFKVKLSEEYEILTNPTLYKNGVNSLKFSSGNALINLSDKFISNIKEIKPRSVFLEGRVLYWGKLNFIDILTELPSKMKITFEKDKGGNSISLWFSNTVLKIFQKDRENFSLFKWKLFKFGIEKRYFKNIKRKHQHTDLYSDWLALRLDNYFHVKFEDFKLISNKEEATEIDHYFPPCIPDFKSKCTVFVLVKNLIDARLDNWIISRKADFGAAQWLFSRWSKLKSFIFKLYLPYELDFINRVSKLPPQNIRLIVCISQFSLQL